MEYNNFQWENEEQEETSFVENFFHYLRYWKFFLISLEVCLGLAYAYLVYTIPQYKVISRIVVSDEKKGQTMGVATMFSDLGIVTSESSLDNEIEVLRSRTLMKSVVDSLRLGVSYFKAGAIKKQEIYKQTPVFVSIPNIMKPGLFVIDKSSENVLLIRSDEENFNQEVATDKEINSPWGMIKLSLNPFGTESYPVEVLIIDPTEYFPDVDINVANKTSSVVELSLITPTPQKGQDIINTLIAHYNMNAIAEKNYVANNTLTFIDERLLTVSSELQTTEESVEDFHKSQGITDIQSQGQLLLTSSSEYNKKITDAGIQLYLLRETKKHLLNPSNKDNPVPANVGLTDPTVISLIGKYNEETLKRKGATAGLSESHPLRVDYDNRIALLRENLVNGINISESGVRSTIRELERQENMFVAKTRNLATQERTSRDLFRQQSLKENIFNYLLQKREETGLSLVMATPNAKIIDSAFVSSVPVKPKRRNILLFASLLGIIIPVVVINIRNLFDNKVHTKDDITKVVKAPFLGYVSVIKTKDTFPVLKVRSSVAEQFRTIIAKLDFIVGGAGRKVITVTSFTSGDGKSFFSRNLAMTLATMGRKTLLVDLDLRKSALAKTLELINHEKGSAVFLSDPSVGINEVIDNSHKFHKNLDIIPVRVFPPNPAELLSSGRLDELFQTIGEKYDYIIIDTAPIGLVADVYSINSHSLATIFLLRSNRTVKKILPEIQEMYKEGKLNSMSIVLNAATDENIYGYGYQYGRYGDYKNNYCSDEKVE